MQTTKTATGKRASREAQYNQRVQAAYLTLRETANRDGQANHRAFSVASTSDPRTHYTLTWDTETDRVHCSCPHGTLSTRGECVHIAAMRRLIAGIHAADARRTDAAAQARLTAESQQRATALMRRDNRSFAERFMK